MSALACFSQELIVDMVLERLETQEAKKNGWLLDGFPRSEGQCKAMQSRGIEPTRFIVLDVPTETLVERVSGRRTDPETGKVYHMKFSPPENEEIKKRLEQRSDDSEEKVRKRDSDFRKYIQEISPYFQKQKKTIDGNRGVDQVCYHFHMFRPPFPPCSLPVLLLLRTIHWLRAPHNAGVQRREEGHL